MSGDGEAGARRRGPGRLLVVATPIGNVADLTERAREALERADLVVAEDTRRTGQLLARLGLRSPLVSCHRFNEASGLERLLAELDAGRTLALVSDAGTPTISDPGHRLVAEAARRGHGVSPLPGACALAAALSVSGFPADRFLFEGFLPSRRGQRRRRIAELARRGETIVLYEAPHRLTDCLRDIEAEMGKRRIVCCRELTKLHEEILRSDAGTLLREFERRDRVRGEIVLVIGPGTPAADQRDEGELDRAYREALELEQGDERRALRRLSRDRELPRAELRRRLNLPAGRPGRHPDERG